MSQIDLSSILKGMTLIGQDTSAPAPVSNAAGDNTPSASFSSLLSKSVAAVSDAQTHAGEMTEAFERGEPGVDIGQTMIATNKADLALTMATQVRNKVVDAYQSIMQMPV